jgi:uncharacterized protein (DUF1330 family)
VIEFPSYQTALDCWNDEVYQRARMIRLPVSTIDLIVLEGYAAPPDPPDQRQLHIAR